MRTYDTIVVGGGLTGCAAAIAAARQCMRVLLLEQSGFLGGAPGNCLINPFMRYWTTVEEGGERKRLDLSAGIFSEMLQALDRAGGLAGTMFHEEYMKLVLDRMVTEAGVQTLLHMTLCGVENENGGIRRVVVAGKSGQLAFCARYFIDCTGDADVAFLAGCPTHLGRPEDHLCQPMTLCFRLANVDMAAYEKSKDTIDPLYKRFQQEGRIQNPREDVLIFHHPVRNMLHFNTTRVIKRNPVDPYDLTYAEMQAREQMFEMYHFLRENIPGFSHADIATSAPQIGVRESRMIDGRHVLTVEELKACTRFDDAIAAGNYDVDIHNPAGAGTSHYYFKEGEYYTIPYRSLQPLGADNLLVAGRCISSTHEAQASYRIMPIVTTLGQAAGVAAAVAARQDVPVAQADIRHIQRILRESGAFIGD